MARYERHGWSERSSARTSNAVARWARDHTPARPAPQSPKAQARFLRDEVYGGSTKRMADAYGVQQRTVQRWIKGTRKMPREATRMAREVADTRQRRAERRARQAAARGEPMRVRAKGWIGPVGSTSRGRARDTPTTRLREMPAQDLTPSQSAALLAAYERDDTDAMQAILSDVYGDYFAGDRSGSGRWVSGADVGELDWIEFS